ncbi:hypothetical protein D3C80_1365640 [compost metagenome]
MPGRREHWAVGGLDTAGAIAGQRGLRSECKPGASAAGALAFGFCREGRLDADVGLVESNSVTRISSAPRVALDFTGAEHVMVGISPPVFREGVGKVRALGLDDWRPLDRSIDCISQWVRGVCRPSYGAYYPLNAKNAFHA